MVACVTADARLAAAYSTGIGGYSNKHGSICTACHGGGVAPDVRFEGPLQVEAGATASYRFVVKTNASAQHLAGFNVAVGDSVNNQFAGLFTPGDGVRNVVPSFANQCPRSLPNCEITHMAPRSVDAHGEAAFDFTWQAPMQSGTYILYGAGNSVNGDGNSTGDKPGATTLQVEVVAPVPTATPSATAAETPTATPTPSETFTLMPTATPTASATATVTPTVTPTPSPRGPVPCVGDCNQDGKIDTAELIEGVDMALERMQLDSCPSFDRNGNGGVDLDEIVAAVDAALSGCVVSEPVSQ